MPSSKAKQSRAEQSKASRAKQGQSKAKDGRWQVSLVHWNQDEEYGGFGGPHCMVVGGYDPILKALAERLDVRLSSPVTTISDTSDGVKVTISSGELQSLALCACILQALPAPSAAGSTPSVAHGINVCCWCSASRGCARLQN